MKPIRTLHQHRAALRRLESLLEAKGGSPQAREAELLFILIADFERRYFPIPAADPLSAIKHRMKQLGLVQRDMIPYFGLESRASEVLNGKRQLTTRMIAALHYGLGIPFESLISIPPGVARRFGRMRHDPVARLAALRMQMKPRRKPGRPRKDKAPPQAGRLTGAARKNESEELDASEVRRLKLLLKSWREKERTLKPVKKKPEPVKKKPVKTKEQKVKKAQEQRVLRLPKKRGK